jgi:hypothetical protein
MQEKKVSEKKQEASVGGKVALMIGGAIALSILGSTVWAIKKASQVINITIRTLQDEDTVVPDLQQKFAEGQADVVEVETSPAA